MILRHRLSIYSSLFASLIFIDQFSKYFIRVKGGFYICNQNLAFSLSPLKFLFITLGLAAIALIINFKFQIINFKSISNYKFQISNFTAFESFSGLLILSGAVSNLIDRLFLGCVIDFFNLPFWPVFNLADIYITIGSIGLLFILTF